MCKIAICPGSYDPITVGHVNIIRRSAALFDKVYVCVADNAEKKYTFSPDERMDFCRRATVDIKNVQVIRCEGLLADKFREIGADVIVKGVRSSDDFAYESDMALINRSFNPSVETVFLSADEEYKDISSSAIKKYFGKDVGAEDFIPRAILDDVTKKLSDI